MQIRRHGRRLAFLLVFVVPPALDAHWAMGQGRAESVGITDGGSSCPTEEQVASALRGQGARLGAADPTWRLSYQTALVEGTRVVRFELRDGRGRLQLQRAVRAADADCGALAETMAVMARRFFEELRWTAGRPLPVAPAVAEPAVARSRLRPLRVWAEAGGGYWNRRVDALTGSAGARLEGVSFGLALQILLPALYAQESRSTGGQATLSGWAATAAALFAWQPARFALAAGPALTFARESGRTTGIDVPKRATGTTLAAGLALRGAWRLSPRWQGGLLLFAMRRVTGDEFAVAGWGRVLEPPSLQMAALVQVACALSP